MILEPGFSRRNRSPISPAAASAWTWFASRCRKLSGRIEIRSQAGQGLTFLLKLPLTLAIIDGLVVTVGSHRYIVPMFAVREMFRPGRGINLHCSEPAGDGPRTRPAVSRAAAVQALCLVPRTEDPSQALLIVAETDGQSFCLMVDDLIGKQEVVIKSLGEGLGKMPGVAGGAILGDGRVGLILDIGGLWGAHVSA